MAYSHLNLKWYVRRAGNFVFAKSAEQISVRFCGGRLHRM